MKQFYCNAKRGICSKINCNTCKKFDESGGYYIEKDEKPKRTNYDNITSSVESLAEIMDNYRWCPYFSNSTCDSEIECLECIKDWLQKECDDGK